MTLDFTDSVRCNRISTKKQTGPREASSHHYDFIDVIRGKWEQENASKANLLWFSLCGLQRFQGMPFVAHRVYSLDVCINRVNHPAFLISFFNFWFSCSWPNVSPCCDSESADRISFECLWALHTKVLWRKPLDFRDEARTHPFVVNRHGVENTNRSNLPLGV